MSEAPKHKGGRPSKHPELGPGCGTAHVRYYQADVNAYHADLRMRGLTMRQLPFTEWLIESCRSYFAMRVSNGSMLAVLDQKLIDVYKQRALDKLSTDFTVYRGRQLAWITANLPDLRKHWPGLHAEELFDELESLVEVSE